jgi:hypothetical protein
MRARHAARRDNSSENDGWGQLGDGGFAHAAQRQRSVDSSEKAHFTNSSLGRCLLRCGLQIAAAPVNRTSGHRPGSQAHSKRDVKLANG